MRELSLAEIKKIQVDMLRELHKLCEKNGWRYFLYAGTLLGAVRHKGFIPWDNDVDIAMPREDYDEFVKLANQQDFRYKVFSPAVNRPYPYAMSKIMATDTKMIETVGNINYKYHVYLDVFPLDRIPESFKSGCKKEKSIQRMKGYFGLISSSQYVEKEKYSLKKRTLWALLSICYKLHIDVLLHKKIEKCAKKMWDNKSGFKWKELIGGGFEYIPSVFDLILCEFEGEELYIPKDFDNVLTEHYGDYMKLPPVEKRVLPHNFKVFID